jgi:hypothetical protein
MSEQPQRAKQLRVEVPANLNAIYANFSIVAATHSEIIIDFAQLMPNDQRVRVQTRIAMTPANAMLFVQALQTNLQMFEEKHGKISLPPKPPSLADQLFGTVKAPDDEA